MDFWHAVSWTGNEAEQLWATEKEVEDLWDEEEEKRLGKMA